MQIKLEPHRIGLRNQFAKKQEKLTEYRRIEAANILSKDMEYQDVYSSISCKVKCPLFDTVISLGGTNSRASKI